MAATTYTITVTADEEAALEWLAAQNGVTTAQLMQGHADSYLGRLASDHRNAQVAQIASKLPTAPQSTIDQINTLLQLG